MAFNPFNLFRRYMKPVMAVLAIFCMFLFVLSGSGFQGADALDVLSQWLKLEGKERPVAKLYGYNVYGSRLADVAQNRRLANAYLTLNLRQTVAGLNAKVDEYLKSEPGRMLNLQLTEVMRSKRTASMGIDFMTGQRMTPEAMLSALQKAVDGTRFLLESDSGKDADRRKHLEMLLAATDAEARLIGRGMGGELYFGGTTDTESLLDFMIWQRQADNLNIRFTPKDTTEALEVETLRNLRPLTDEDRKAIDSGLGNAGFKSVTAGNILDALAEEFRVRAAKVALTGTWDGMQPRTATATPTWLTPFGFYQSYRDDRTTLSLGLIPVKAEDYLPRVASEKPPEEALRKLYDEYKNVEPNPIAATPGFKEPRRIGLQYIDLRGEVPAYFTTKATDTAKAARAVSQAFAGLGVEGGGFVAPVVAAATPLLFDAEKARLYDEYAARIPLRRQSWTSPYMGLDNQGMLNETSLLATESPQRKGYPAPIAGFVGQLLGQAGTGVPGPLSAASLPGHALAREIFDRSHVGLTMVGVGLSLDGPLTAAGLPLGAVPKHLSYEQIGPLLDTQSVEKSLSRQLRDKEVADLRKEISTRGAKPAEREKLREYIAAWLAERGMTLGGTERGKPRGMHTLKDDPGMSAMVSGFTNLIGDRDPLVLGFGPYFFDGKTISRSWEPIDYPPASFPGAPSDFIVWRTEDEPAKVLSFEEARPRVEAAWRLNQARELAEAAAKDLAKVTETKKGDIKAIRDLAAEQKPPTSVVELDNVSLMVVGEPQITPTSLPRRTYRPYSLPAGKFPLPTPDFTRKLLDFRDKEVGATEVLPNLPKTTFYVTTLEKKEVPPPVPTDTLDRSTAFASVWTRSVPGTPGQDMLRESVVREQTGKYLTDLTAQLRKEAKLEVLVPTKRDGQPALVE